MSDYPYETEREQEASDIERRDLQETRKQLSGAFSETEEELDDYQARTQQDRL